MEIVIHPTISQENLKDDNQYKNNINDKASNGKKNKTAGGRGGQNEGGGGKGNRDKRDLHPSILWSEAVRYEDYAIYDTPNLCFPDTNTNKRKITTTMTTDNVDCDHDTVREGVKSCMESV